MSFERGLIEALREVRQNMVGTLSNQTACDEVVTSLKKQKDKVPAKERGAFLKALAVAQTQGNIQAMEDHR
jgi:hypothetical protein